MRLYKHQYFPSDISMPVNAPDELQNPKILQMNRLAPRATMIPAQTSGIYYQNKERSDRLFSLNGDYRFAYFSDTAPNGFEQSDFDTSDWDILNVPSMWQYCGYGEPTYPNIRTPFPFCPPYVLRLNPVGCYHRTFMPPADRLKDRTILHFEGVDNAFYVYLNGSFVGFSKGSRLPAEFDVTDLLVDGENTLAVKVYTYSDATYLENQDMLMANGIFRDVYLMFMPKTALWDWELITDTETLTLTATLFDKTDDATARITFDGKIVTLPFVNGLCKYQVSPEAVKLWSAEIPNLYDLTLEIFVGDTLSEVHSKRIGFMKSEVVGREFHVNGKKVIMRGLNRHENDPKTGRYLTVEQTRADLELIKSHNINAIRCAHYPNTPAFYEIASELGIYVMDECDLESHGASVTGDQGYLNKDPEWLDAFMDRMVRMAERDKNETCIALWSVGNEIGAGQNADACAAYLKSRTDKKPVQVHAVAKADQDILYSGYPSLLKLDKFCNSNIDSGKPLMLLEYAHAMGNGPGNQQNLWDYIIDHPEFVGGYVWEFRSHGMERINEDGSIDYLYGGDFHDTNHWGHFTLDGFCTSNGTPKPTFLELKYVFTPVRLNFLDGKLLIHNIQSFLSTEGLMLERELVCDGEIVSHICEPMPIVPPMTKAEFPLLLGTYQGHDCFLNLRIRKTDDTVLEKQITLPSTMLKKAFVPAGMTAKVSVDQDRVSVTGDRFEIRFANGVPTYYEKDQTVYFDTPMQLITYRAETDNDGIRKVFPRWIGAWEGARLHKLRFYCFKTVVTQQETNIAVHTKGKLIYDAVSTGFDVETDYKVYADGLLTTVMTVKPFGKMPCIVYDTPDPIDPLTPRLPRFGVCFQMNQSFDRVTWFGRGVDQNYDDAISAAPVGLYSLPLTEMNFEYDMPQETGNRGDTRYARIQNGDTSFTVYGNETFAFSYHPWRLDDLREAMHKSELKKDASNYLYIDYKMRALGSHSCGPNPERELDFEPHDFEFVFAINGETAAEPEYFLTDFGPKTKKLTEEYTYVPLTGEREAVECEQ